MVILGIETSCDETSIGIINEKREILSLSYSSQEDIHKRYGGVVPELASRNHLEVIDILFKDALQKAKITSGDIDLIGVTAYPGLKGSLLIGLTFARTLSFLLKIPLIELNHLQAHLAVNYLRKEMPEFPAIGLVVSGGHTSLFLLKDAVDFQLLGETRDDAAGEVLDKIGRLLGLDYPGGPKIEKEAKKGNPEKIKYPRPLLGKTSLDFSFSGLKTSVVYYVKKNGKKNISDICAGLQAALIETLCEKARRAIEVKKAKSLLLGGGVTANQRLKKGMEDLTESLNIPLFYPPPFLCTDNGVMVACLALFLR